jgi:hypothetical protein
MCRIHLLNCGCEVKTKKEIFHCSHCNKSLCAKHSFCYYDSSNEAITKNNNKSYCEKCYVERYGNE